MYVHEELNLNDLMIVSICRGPQIEREREIEARPIHASGPRD
jgi:hypothetical protein